jgi:hypothetical protein
MLTMENGGGKPKLTMEESQWSNMIISFLTVLATLQCGQDQVLKFRTCLSQAALFQRCLRPNLKRIGMAVVKSKLDITDPLCPTPTSKIMNFTIYVRLFPKMLLTKFDKN